MQLGVLAAALLLQREPPRVLVAVNTAQTHREHRDLARKSWLTALPWAAKRYGFSVEHRFVFAGGPGAARGEAEALELSAPEGYLELPQKTLGLLAWFAKSDFQIMVEVDDDVFVHAEPLFAELQQLQAVSPLYAGYTQQMPTPENAKNASKWFIASDAVRERIPRADYVTGQLKIVDRAAAAAAVAQAPNAGMEPYGRGDKSAWMPIEDEYVGVLMHAAGVPVQPRLQAAVAPQCCQAGDLAVFLDGDEFFAKTSATGGHKWNDATPAADSLCRYRLAVAHFAQAPGQRFCLSPEELRVGKCPPAGAGPTADVDAYLAGICGVRRAWAAPGASGGQL